MFVVKLKKSVHKNCVTDEHDQERRRKNATITTTKMATDDRRQPKWSTKDEGTDDDRKCKF